MYGILVPTGGGDNIPLLKKDLLVGRRESCDIVLRFQNVSAHHCKFSVVDGYWFIQDLNSRNGVKVNGERVEVGERRIDPGDQVAIAKHKFKLDYSPMKLGAVGPPPSSVGANVFDKPLLERAGLQTQQDRDKLEKDDEDLKRRLEAAATLKGNGRKDPNRMV
ncbi:MAG: FHA domain-containing protein [Pirellulales bacterium]|nr:FHA domain-containing protein [Pirellulales bacterium]